MISLLMAVAITISVDCQVITHTPAGDIVKIDEDCISVDTPFGELIVPPPPPTPEGYVNTPWGDVPDPNYVEPEEPEEPGNPEEPDPEKPGHENNDKGCFINSIGRTK